MSERRTTGGHTLRSRADLLRSSKLIASANGPRRKRRSKAGALSKNMVRSFSLSPSTGKRTVAMSSLSSRQAVRHGIATKTAAQRARFFVANKDYFLPLLPEHNHIARLHEKASLESVERSSAPTADVEGQDKVHPYESITEQPQGVRATMKPYQLAGLSFLIYLYRNGLSGILGDEMGLGKTLQTLALLQYLKEHRPQDSSGDEIRPSLVVCPLSVLSSWMSEARRWTPELKVIRFHGPALERNRLKRIAEGKEDFYGHQLKSSKTRSAAQRSSLGLSGPSMEEPGVDVVVTTYETFQSEQSWFKRAFVWTYVVLDEGHKIKNDLSLVSTALQGLGAEYRLILTGTPLQNNLAELWALLHWLYPDVFTEKTAELFQKSFNLTKGHVSTSVLDDARRLLELVMLRRMKTSPGVDLDLPPKTEVLLFVPLTPMQRFWYERLLTRADQGLLDELFQDAKGKEKAALAADNNEINETEPADMSRPDQIKVDGDLAMDEWKESREIMKQALEQESLEQTSGAWRKLMNLLMQLRKCCNHPYLLPNAEPSPYSIGEHIIRASGKFIVLDKLIEELVIKQSKKVIIFSTFTKMLDCCEDFLSLRGGDGQRFQYARLDGSTCRARRNLGIRLFNDRKSSCKVMLISTRAGGLGINLASASEVILMDQDWNPQITLQAEARAHRIGQTQPVTVYKLCTQGTVEEQMMGRIQKKLYLSAKVTESMRNIHTSSARKAKISKAKVGADEDMPQLDTQALMTLVRRGAQTLTRPEIDVNKMLDWDWQTTLEMCKDKPVDVHVAVHTQSGTQVKEHDEARWLSEVEAVSSYVFNGKKYAREKEDAAALQLDVGREARRLGKNTTVMVDGHAVSKESMRCKEWEAVPTMAGTDPRLAERKREKKAEIVNQEHCQTCWDGGDLVCCSGCPRSYHHDCLDEDSQKRTKTKSGIFYCSQHHCFDCNEKTGNAGGMLYRCRWCEHAYCEDCLEWDRVDLIGDNLLEYETLGFPEVDQAFYVRCGECKDRQEHDPQVRRLRDDFEILFRREHDAKFSELTLERSPQRRESQTSRAASLTDAATIEGSGVTTPVIELDEAQPSRKRKAADVGGGAPAAKRFSRPSPRTMIMLD
ncbi:MAG: hypothetical protein M1838_002372 [Thelocarpon superellum]|nr:MAG: hypothetical protein M1838_002372 [Thelocarpon superellum]